MNTSDNKQRVHTRQTNKQLRNNQQYKTSCIIGLLTTMIFGITGCQTISTALTADGTVTPISAEDTLVPQRLDSFSITGKIGIVNKMSNQSGSAFYGWAQEQERFNIELQGALGLGYTLISYDGNTATLTNSDVGSISSKTPEDLLLTATGWKAPISQLPYWISGSPAPSDTTQVLDSKKRLIKATNEHWTANFVYDDNATLPKKIISRYNNSVDDSSTHHNGSKVVLTIMHN